MRCLCFKSRARSLVTLVSGSAAVILLIWLSVLRSRDPELISIRSDDQGSLVGQRRCSCPAVAGIISSGNPAGLPSTGDEAKNETQLQARAFARPCGSRYGKAVLHDDITLVYNRVQKCGSRGLVLSIRSLVKRNGIHGPVSMVPDKFKDELGLLTRTVNAARLQPRAVVEGHVRFHDLNDERVFYINIVRDPLNRLVSSFYFNRYGDGLLSPAQLTWLRERTKPEVIDETFDECVRNNRTSCTGPKMLSHVMGFFCGYHPVCRTPTRWTLEEAKRNLDRYTVVGIVEEYTSTLRALEFLFPSMLNGLVKKYNQLNVKQDIQSRAHAHKMVPPSPQTVALMRERLALEYEFYDHVRARFHGLLDELHLRDDPDVR